MTEPGHSQASGGHRNGDDARAVSPGIGAATDCRIRPNGESGHGPRGTARPMGPGWGLPIYAHR
jgi:hypothetical protein